MKKILLGIIVIMAVFSMILPSVSYGICNTIKFNKQVCAVTLTLQNGTVMNNIQIDREEIAQTDITEEQYKNLNIIFVVQTTTNSSRNTTKKQELFKVVDDMYNIYGAYGNNKIRMGAISFRDSEIDENAQEDCIVENVLKSGKSEIQNSINSITSNANNNANKRRSLKTALESAKENFDSNRNRNK